MKKLIVSAMAAILLVAGGTTARADEPLREHAMIRIDPVGPGVSLRYRLFVQGVIRPGFGLQLTYVDPFGPAANVTLRNGLRARLEAGDVIVQVNGRQINTARDYFWAMNSSGGWVNLLVKDVRGGPYTSCTTVAR